MLARSRRIRLPEFERRDTGLLIVADPDASAFVMVRQLTAPDVWDVKYAETAEELMRMLHSGPVELAVVDLFMVDGSPELGEELVARSRRGLKVVVTTDTHNETNERRARMLGPVFYAPKPLNIELLGHVLEGALGAVV